MAIFVLLQTVFDPSVPWDDRFYRLSVFPKVSHMVACFRLPFDRLKFLCARTVVGFFECTRFIDLAQFC